jgi:hypothetical protein
MRARFLLRFTSASGHTAMGAAASGGDLDPGVRWTLWKGRIQARSGLGGKTVACQFPSIDDDGDSEGVGRRLANDAARRRMSCRGRLFVSEPQPPAFFLLRFRAVTVC